MFRARAEIAQVFERVDARIVPIGPVKLERIRTHLADILDAAQLANGIARCLPFDADRSQALLPGLARGAGTFLAQVGKIVNAFVTIGPVDLHQPVVNVENHILGFVRERIHFISHTAAVTVPRCAPPTARSWRSARSAV